MRKINNIIVIFLLIGICVIAVFIKKNFYNGFKEYYASQWRSGSIKEAKKRKIFIKEISITPQTISENGLNIEFKESWIEKEQKLKYKLIFFGIWKTQVDIIFALH